MKTKCVKALEKVVTSIENDGMSIDVVNRVHEEGPTVTAGGKTTIDV